MLRSGLRAVGLFAALMVAGPVSYALADGAGQTPIIPHKGEVINSFLAEHPTNNFTYAGNRIDRVYGPAFSSGANPQESAENFRQNYSGMWGVPAGEVVAVWPHGDGDHLQGIMYTPQTGQYKFTGAFYTQQRAGIPVFRSKLVLLVRNEANHPLVLATSSLRDLGAFDAATALQNVNINGATANLLKIVGEAEISEPSLVIWAGVDDVDAQPRLALQYITETVGEAVENYQKWLFVMDAITGDVLYQESKIHHTDIVGNVSGMATTGYGADVCGGIASVPLPYATVTAGATTVYTDVNGNYVLPNPGVSPVNVSSAITGLYFEVFNYNGTSTAGPPTSITQAVTPPGPGDFMHNAANTNPFNRAEVNCYIHANVVRDYVLAHDPGYPVIAGQTSFDVRVNRNATCNAFYNGSSINFYIAGGGCSNTGNSTVVYHEYGHHLVESAGSGQGAYGEGMSDCVAIIVSDDHCLGNGFNSCGVCLRSGNNPCQYQASGCSSCGSAIHTCGQIISGCVWKLRNNLQASNPLMYRQTLANLTINSIKLHTGTTITPSITVDFCTLDDDDSDISNGTPHYNEINAAFSAHSMPAPPLAALLFSYPDGKPEYVSPAGGTTMRVVINGNPSAGTTPQPGSGKLFVSSGGPYTEYPMTVVAPNVYDAVFPGFPCGTGVKYYLSAQTTGAQTVNSPTNAPSTTFAATSAIGIGETLFEDNFQTDLGWGVSNSAGLTTGMWERGVPVSPPPQAAPPTDADGSGMCYVTQNLAGNFDIDGGSTTLTSPNLDISQGVPILSYYRWYSNSTGAAPQADTMVVEVSFNGGSTWTTLEVVGPTTSSPNPEVTGGWFHKSFSLMSVPGYVATSQFRVRFTASDLGSGSLVEAGVDGLRITSLDCLDPCPSDVNGDAMTNVADMLAVINAWGPCLGCAADVNGDGNVNVADMLAVINAWGACP